MKTTVICLISGTVLPGMVVIPDQAAVGLCHPEEEQEAVWEIHCCFPVLLPQKW